MKRFLLTFCAVLFSIAVFAQEHMTFKGIPMGCDLTTFVSKLKDQGFTQEKLNVDIAVLTGDFAGKTNCRILVAATKQTKQVWKVVVSFPERTSWYSLKDEYQSFKKSYTNKYGKPESYEFFSSPYKEGDGYELQAVRLDKCNYSSFFKLDAGTIWLTISEDENVDVHYEDKITYQLKNKEQESSVTEDI